MPQDFIVPPGSNRELSTSEEAIKILLFKVAWMELAFANMFMSFTECSVEDVVEYIQRAKEETQKQIDKKDRHA